jgi:hypothetical protein
MEHNIHYQDTNKIKKKNFKNNNISFDIINNDKNNLEINDNNIGDVLDKMKNNINNMKIKKPIKEKQNINNNKNINNINIKNNIINNDNIIINSFTIENKFINNNANILYINNKNDLNKNNFADLLKENNINNSIQSIKNINLDNNNNNDNKIDENLNISEDIKIDRNKKENKNNINILQNLKGISNQNIGYGSTLMSNVSYSSFLSFKNKKVKFVNLNTSVNQSMVNKSRREELKKQEEEDKEKINKLEQEKIMKNIMERFGCSGDIIKENQNENENEEKEKDINEYNKMKYNNKNNIHNDINDREENESLLFKISKQYDLNKKKSKNEEKDKINNILDNKETHEQKINITNIKCTLSFFDKGKAIFVSENDDIFWLPSSSLNENIKVGNSYLFSINKINNKIKKMNEIEIIQNKYKEWK